MTGEWATVRARSCPLGASATGMWMAHAPTSRWRAYGSSVSLLWISGRIQQAEPSGRASDQEDTVESPTPKRISGFCRSPGRKRGRIYPPTRSRDRSLLYDENSTVAGTKFDITTQPFVEVRCAAKEGVTERPPLLIAPLVNETIALFVGGDKPDGKSVVMWQRATQHAAENIGKEGPLHEWSAILGPPSARMGGTEVLLAEEGHIGPFTLVSADPRRCGSGSSSPPGTASTRR